VNPIASIEVISVDAPPRREGRESGSRIDKLDLAERRFNLNCVVSIYSSAGSLHVHLESKISVDISPQENGKDGKLKDACVNHGANNFSACSVRFGRT
jgi:hypothetical protein